MGNTASIPAAPAAAAAPAWPDWPHIHPERQAPLPFGEEVEFASATPTVLRGLFVDLADPAGNGTPLAELLQRRRAPSARLEIHADVLRVSGHIVLPLQALLIHARRIEVAAGAELQLAEAVGARQDGVTLDVYAEQIATAAPGGHWEIVFLGLRQGFGAADAPGHLQARRQRDASGGLSLASPRPVHELVPGDALQALAQLSAARRLQFTAASPRLPDPRRLALDIALWVHRSQRLAGGNAGLAAEGRALAHRLSNPRRDVHAVPALDWTTYHALALHMADSLVQVEAQSQLYFARGEWREAQKQAARDLRAQADAAQLLTTRLRDQAAAELATAQDAWAASKARLDAQRSDNEGLAATFEKGVEHKRLMAEIEAGAEVVGALLIIGAAIGGACMGTPTGALEVVQKVSKLRRIVDMVNLVGGLLEKIYKMYEMVSKTVDKIARTGDYLDWGTKDLCAKSPSAAQWEAFRLDMEAAFDEALRLEIDGAAEYLAGLQKLAVFGRDLVDCGLHVLRCDAVHQQRLWEETRDSSDRAVIAAQLDRLGDGRPDLQVRCYYEQLQDALRLDLLQTLQKVDDAYRYHVLREPRHTASVDMPAVKLRALVVQSEADMVAGLEAFHTTPSSWTPRPWRLSALPKAQAQAALHRLRTRRTLAWLCAPAMLADADRVRVEAIHVWLAGVGVPGVDIHIDIATSGCYSDRFAGQILRFVAPPLDRSFAYTLRASGPPQDVVGHAVDVTRWGDDKQHLFTQPTAFATWELRIADGPSLDGLTDLAIEFVGSCMRATPARPGTVFLLAPAEAQARRHAADVLPVQVL